MKVATATRLKNLISSVVNCSMMPITIKFMVVNIVDSILRRSNLDELEGMVSSQYGTKLAGSPADFQLNRVLFYRGIFEPNLSKLICELVNEGDFCVDAGANTGYFTMLMAKQVADTGHVVAIEASPGNANQLKKNIAVNGFQHRTTIIEAACSDKKGSFDFYVNAKNDMFCRMELPKINDIDYWYMGKNWTKVSVPGNTLSSLVEHDLAKISFIKLDVEGTEHKIVADILANFTHPELCIAIEAKQPHLVATLKPFEEAGFTPYDLQNDYKWIVTDHYKSVSKTTFEQLYQQKNMVDVLLTRVNLDTKINHLLENG